MKNQTIQLISNVLINGQQAGPNDKNKGVYTVTEAEAKNLIARKRAIKFDGVIEDTEPDKFLEDLKEVADELKIKYNPSIGAPKLEAKILAVLEKAEDDGLTFREDLPILEAYKLYKAEKAKKEAGGNDKDKIPVDRLEEIAKAAKIEIAQDVEEDGLQDFIEVELEQYAGELGIEIAEDDNAETLWAKIQEKLKGKDE